MGERARHRSGAGVLRSVVTATRAPETSGSGATTHSQVWFGPAERPLYGWLSMPAGGTARGGALLCPPMGEEGRSAHRTFRRLAEELAAVGIVALRFDYDGTGDSAGLQDDPDRVASWLAGVEAARALLVDLGAPGVAAVGMRLGATIAAAQAARSPGTSSPGAFSDLVLWDPCPSGRTFLREGEALLSFGAESGAPLDPAFRHTPGFQYDHDTAAAMRRLAIATLPTQRPLAGRVLLLTRDDRPSSPELVARLRLEGDRLTHEVALDQSDLMDLEPSDCFVPERALARVVAWLAAGVAEQEPRPLTAPGPERPVLLASGAPGSVLVRERSVRLGDFGVYGIVDEPVPDGPDAAPEVGPRPWVVLVNVAAEHHIGPGRKWVEFARSWAGLGYRSVRIDQSGVGDSPTHPGQLQDMHFTPEWMEDMSQVVRELSADGSPVILVGLCSGAYSGLEAAMWEDVAGVFTINPRVTLYAAAKGTPLWTPRRRAAVVPAKPVAELAESRRILAGGLWRIYRQVAVWHAPLKVLHRVVRRGTRLAVVACHDDGQHFTEVLAWRPVLWWMRRRGRFSLEVDDVFDHSMLTRAGQLATADRATAFVASFHAEGAVS